MTTAYTLEAESPSISQFRNREEEGEMRWKDVMVTAAVSLGVSLAVRGLSPTYRISMGPGGWVSFRGRRPSRVTIPRRRSRRMNLRRRAS